MKKINLFLYSLIFFSLLIFFMKDYFFWVSENELNNYIENHHIEKTITKNEILLNHDDHTHDEKIENDNIKVSLKSAYNINYNFYPSDFEKDIPEYLNNFKFFLNNKSIIEKIDNLRVEFYKQKNDVRWKMKNHTVKLYWVESMDHSECNAVWIHEFAHFIDLYFLKKEVFTDLSDYFYNISWESTKTIKAWLNQKDFVSGYAMTNKYEDFAESFTYFILHNEDFLSKAEESEILKKKYNYFIKYLFREGKFVGTDFSEENEILTYYRDITKINFSLENFLDFLKK